MADAGALDLSELAVAIARAKAEADSPPGPEGKATLPVDAYLRDDELDLLWECVRALRREHPRVFNLFSEELLASSVVDELTGVDGVPTLEALAGSLEARGKAQGPWLISVPLANAELPQPFVPISERVALHRAFLELEGRDPSAADVDIEFAVVKHFNDRLPPPTRWLHLTTEPGAVDTRRTAALLTVGEGPIAVATARVRSMAQYAIAVWTIVHPPEEFELVADPGLWVPQPFMHIGPRYKVKEAGSVGRRARTQGGSIQHFAPYTLPEGDDILLPFEALDQAKDHRCSQALLSASLALFQASRGSRFLLSERVRLIRVAIETLCEREAGAKWQSKRWEHVKERHGAKNAFVRGYTDSDIEELEERLQQARNIASHGADAVLLDLGFPEELERTMRYGDPVPGEELSLSGLQADVSSTIGAVRTVLEGLLRHMREHAWDDDEFNRQFVGPT